MADRPRPDDDALAAHIESIAARNDFTAGRLARMLARHAWPGGGSDHHSPAAVEWVRRWGPRGLTPLAPECSCAQGRCAVCN
jgi:hypothetical protein